MKTFYLEKIPFQWDKLQAMEPPVYRHKAKSVMKLPIQPTLQNQVELRQILAASLKLTVVKNKAKAGTQKLYQEKQILKQVPRDVPRTAYK